MTAKRMKVWAGRIAKGLFLVWVVYWFLSAIVTLWPWGMATFHWGEHPGEVQMVSSLAILFAGFPLTFVVPLFFEQLPLSMNIEPLYSPLFFGAELAASAILGYLQWFVIVPWVWRHVAGVLRASHRSKRSRETLGVDKDIERR